MMFKEYKVTWCNQCETAIILCDKCNNGSCNGGGCDECINDFIEFSKISGKILKCDLPVEDSGETPEDKLLSEIFGK